MVIHHVATLSVHQCCAPLAPLLLGLQGLPVPLMQSGEFSNIISPMPWKVRTQVSLRPYRLRSLESPMNVPRVLFRDTDASSSDSDGVLFPECSTLSSSGECFDVPDEPDVPLSNSTMPVCRVTRSLTQWGLGNHPVISQDFE